MIKIKTEKIKMNGCKYRRILSISGIRCLDKFDNKYRDGFPCVGTDNEKTPHNIIIFANDRACVELKQDYLYSEDLFQERIEIIKKAGERAHKIGLKWEGVETFKI